jgi:prolyl 4-hydroxylase
MKRGYTFVFVENLMDCAYCTIADTESSAIVERLDRAALAKYQHQHVALAPELIIIHNFVNRDEIDGLLEIADQRWNRSKVVKAGGGDYVDESRTSYSAFFSSAETDLVRRIEDRTKSLLQGAHSITLEGLQLVKYSDHQRFDPHHDYFDPSTSRGNNELTNLGQRIITLLVYLVEPDSGGATTFPTLGISVPPKAGSAVLWYNCDAYGHEYPETLHAGMPVETGTKVAVNIWIRQKLNKRDQSFIDISLGN